MASAPPASRTLVALEAPPVTIRHPLSLERDARWVASAYPAVVARLQRALDAPPQGPVTVYLLPGGGFEDPGGPPAPPMPDWAAGIAAPDQRLIVIRLDRVGRYAQRGLAPVLAHETAHIVAHDAAGAGARLMPAWFREGLASHLARDGEWLDHVYLWASPLPASSHPLEILSGWFRSDGLPSSRQGAYAGAFSFVRLAVARHGEGLPSRVLAGLRGGLDFESAWARAAGTSLARDEAAWSARLRGARWWIRLASSSFALWTGITALVVAAYLRKRRRGRRTLQAWSLEEPPD